MTSIPTTRDTWVLPALAGRTGYASLERKETELPALGESDVLVKVHATSLNYRDLIVASNTYRMAKADPLIPLSDGAGEVLAVGPKVTKWSVGDRVAGNFNRDHIKGNFPTTEETATGAGGAIDGWLASHVVYPEHGLVRIPSHLSYEEGATLPCAAVTALNALIGLPGFEAGAGDAVIIEGTGGVSVFALQLAVASGSRVAITSSSDEKLAKVLTFIPEHAHNRVHTINYKTTPDWGPVAVEKLGSKAKVVVEVGGNKTLTEAYKAIAPGGVIASIGFVAGQATPIDANLQSIYTASILRGILIGPRELFERLNSILESHEIHPVVDKVFDFADALDAYAHLESQKHIGKVVIRVP